MGETIVTRGLPKPDLTLILVSFFVVTALPARADEGSKTPVTFRLILDRGHPWRPPFGLDRVGMPPAVVVRASDRPAGASYLLAVRRGNRELGRRSVRFPGSPPYSVRMPIADDADEVMLFDASGTNDAVELARAKVVLPALEADAIARPDTIVNPVDLGAILVPSGRLLLGPGQSATLDVAAIARDRDRPGARLVAWYDCRPEPKATVAMALTAGTRRRQSIKLPESPPGVARDSLSVVLEDGDGRAFWRKSIPVMLVPSPPRPPRFGATRETLRYDTPISVRDPKTGTYSTMSYQGAWPAGLDDVVVWLPNGARYVFWRGSSYIPFWAGRHNTGACYEWAEMISQPAGAVDCVEPLMDKELRYSRVAIVESTAARVHVRWTYQSTDLLYKVWGDEAVEDYYFYPDGFGTRVVNLKADPANNYELSEFIILTPPGAYPFAVLPDDPVDALFLDRRKHAFRFPNPTAGAARPVDSGDAPAIYRLRLGGDRRTEPPPTGDGELAAVYFNPNETKLPPVVFAPFFDQGEMVTPCYWGSHWPLARGNATGNAIDDRIGLTPCHNSVMSWAGTRPRPLRTAELVTLDTLGRSRPMTVRSWAWLIGMTGEPDARLVERAKSFAAPPALELRGARVGFEGYAPERRAIRVIVEAPEVAITIKPGPPCVNPVFEFDGVPRSEARVTLAGQPLEPARYAWDGRMLWLDATIRTPAELRVTFGAGPGQARRPNGS
jgi:hypothetical protein